MSCSNVMRVICVGKKPDKHKSVTIPLLEYTCSPLVITWTKYIAFFQLMYLLYRIQFYQETNTSRYTVGRSCSKNRLITQIYVWKLMVHKTFARSSIPNACIQQRSDSFLMKMTDFFTLHRLPALEMFNTVLCV